MSSFEEMWKTLLNLVAEYEIDQLDKIMVVAKELIYGDDPGLFCAPLEYLNALALEEQLNMWLLNQIMYSESINQNQSATNKLVEFQTELLTVCFAKKRATFKNIIKKYIIFTQDLIKFRRNLQIPMILEFCYSEDIKYITEIAPTATSFKITFQRENINENIEKCEKLISNNIKVIKHLLSLSDIRHKDLFLEFTESVLDTLDICSFNLKIICLEYLTNLVNESIFKNFIIEIVYGCLKILEKLPLAVENDCLDLNNIENLIVTVENLFTELESKIYEDNSIKLKSYNVVDTLIEISIIVNDKAYEKWKNYFKNYMQIILNITNYLCAEQLQFEKLFIVTRINAEFYSLFKSIIIKDLLKFKSNSKYVHDHSSIWSEIEKIFNTSLNAIQDEISQNILQNNLNILLNILKLINSINFEYQFQHQLQCLNAEGECNFCKTQSCMFLYHQIPEHSELQFLEDGIAFDNKITIFLKKIRPQTNTKSETLRTQTNNINSETFIILLNLLNELIQSSYFGKFTPNLQKMILDYFIQYINKVINLPHDFPFSQIYSENVFNQIVIKSLSNMKFDNISTPVKNHINESFDRILYRIYVREDLKDLQEYILENILKFLLHKSITFKDFEEKILNSIIKTLKNPQLLLNYLHDVICYLHNNNNIIVLKIKQNYKIICNDCDDKYLECCSISLEQNKYLTEISKKNHGILIKLQNPTNLAVLNEFKLLEFCDILTKENASKKIFVAILNHCDFTKNKNILNNWIEFLPKIFELVLEQPEDIKNPICEQFVGDLLDMVSNSLQKDDANEQRRVLEIITKYSSVKNLPEKHVYYTVKLCIIFLIYYESHVPYLASLLASDVCSKHNFTPNNIVNWYQREILQLIANLCVSMYLLHEIGLPKSLDYVSQMLGYKGPREFLFRHQDAFITMILPKVIEVEKCEKLLEDIASYSRWSIEDLLRKSFLTFYLEHFVREKTSSSNKCLDYIIKKTNRDFFTLINLDTQKSVARMLIYYHKNPKAVMDTFRCLILKENNPSLASTSSMLSQRTTADITKFLAEGFLGVLNHFEIYLMSSDSQKNLKIEILLSLGKIMRLLGTEYVTQFHFKILATLSTVLTLQDSEVKQTCIEVWNIFIHNVNVQTLGPSLSRIVASLEPLLNTDQKKINAIYKFLILENGNLLSMYIPDLFFISKFNVTDDIRMFVAQHIEKKLRTNNLNEKIEFYMKQVTHENVLIRVYGLNYLKKLFAENRRGLNKMILGQNFISPVLENVLDNLMLGCKHSDNNLKLISSKCIGELGAIEPGLIRPNYSQEQNVFPLGVHTDDFVIIALKDLCKAIQFQKDTVYVDNFSLGIQQILRTSGVCPKTKSKMHVWEAIPERMRQIMEPLLTSLYTGNVQNQENSHIHPVYGSHLAKNYILWAFYWASNMIERIENIETKDLLKSLLPSLRRDSNILDEFLPYIVLHSLQFSNVENVQRIFKEFQCVFHNALNNDLNFNHENNKQMKEIELITCSLRTSKKSNDEILPNAEYIGKKCAKICFDLLDFLERWMREHFTVYRNENDKNYEVIKNFVESFNKFELAQANFNCGEYARALKYCEAHLKNSSNLNTNVQNYLSFLIKNYVELMDTDSLEGAIYIKESQSSLKEQILVNSMTDRLQETAACYEQLIKELESTNKLNTLNYLDWDGIVQCYLRLDTPETALLVSQGIMQKLSKQFTDECLKESQVEPLWRLGRFNELETLLENSQIKESKSWQVQFGSALLLFHNKNITYDNFEIKIDEIRHNVLKIMKFGAADCDSYHKGYSQVTKLHLLTDIEKAKCLINQISNFSNEDESISTLTQFFDEWNERLGFLQPTIKITEPFLCLRRVLLTETKNLLRDNQNFSSFENLIDNEIGKLWIRSVQLNREAGCYQQAHLNILNAEKYKPENLFIEKAKLCWVKGDQPNCFKVIEDKINEIEKLDILPLPVEKRLLYAEAKFLQASYNAESMNINPDLNKKYFNESIKNNNKSEKCYVALAEYHDKIYGTLDQANQQSEYGQRTLLSILYNYTKSLQYGCEFLYQSMPRMLSIWFEINDVKGGIYSITSSQNSNSYIKKINELMESSSQSLPLFLYFTAYSQIISRVCHPSEDVWKTIKNIVVRLIEKYSQHSLWMILPVFKSSLPSRIRRCHDIFGDKRLKNVQMQKLIKDFNSFAEKFIEFTNIPIQKGQTPTVSSLVPTLPKLFSDRDFSRIMMPFEKYLQMSLPSLGQRNCSLNSFNPFPNELVYIKGIREEIEVITSLQRPKKTILIGSDGKEYTILLKPNDDLRKDFRLMEFNNIVKQYLYQNPKARQRRLDIRTYAVMPLNEECGIIEWVGNLRAFRQIIMDTYKLRKVNFMSVKELKRFGEKENDPQKRRDKYIKELLGRHPPVFYKWFLERFSNPHNWYQARTTYMQSTAVMSIVGYILGLGDRHGENILLDGRTGDTVHVDFNCLFNRAELFAFPEKVPFRLTHNMVDAMGPLGTEGTFKKCCEITMHVLKANTQILMSVLRPFIYDPLVSWNKNNYKNDRNVERTDDGAITNVKRTEARLKGYVNHEATGANMPLSSEGVVNYVIQKAMDVDNLAAMYVGWGPYL